MATLLRETPVMTPAPFSRWKGRVGRAAVEVRESASGMAQVSQDTWMIRPRSDAVRLAAIDGATPPPGSPTFGGLDAAAWAAQVVRAVLVSADAAEQCLAYANAVLFDPAIERAGARPQAAAVVADVVTLSNGRGHAEIVRASDCVAVARVDERWHWVFPIERLAPTAAAVWDDWLTDHPDASFGVQCAAEEVLIGNRDAWRTAAVGRYEELLVEHAEITGFDRLVLASDGARLEYADLTVLDRWLDGLRSWEREQDLPGKRHDDVTVVTWNPA